MQYILVAYLILTIASTGNFKSVVSAFLMSFHTCANVTAKFECLSIQRFASILQNLNIPTVNNACVQSKILSTQHKDLNFEHAHTSSTIAYTDNGPEISYMRLARARLRRYICACVLAINSGFCDNAEGFARMCLIS